MRFILVKQIEIWKLDIKITYLQWDKKRTIPNSNFVRYVLKNNQIINFRVNKIENISNTINNSNIYFVLDKF